MYGLIPSSTKISLRYHVSNNLSKKPSLPSHCTEGQVNEQKPLIRKYSFLNIHQNLLILVTHAVHTLVCYHTFSELAADAVEAPEGGGGRRMKSYKPLIDSLVVPERMPLEISADA